MLNPLNLGIAAALTSALFHTISIIVYVVWSWVVGKENYFSNMFFAWMGINIIVPSIMFFFVGYVLAVLYNRLSLRK
jgi:hypothetical protein